MFFNFFLFLKGSDQMNTELHNRILAHKPYDCGWDTVFAPPIFGIDSDAEDEVLEQHRALNDPKIAQLALLRFMQGMEALLAYCKKEREKQELAALEEELDKYEEYDAQFNFFGNCVGSRKLAGIECLAEPSCHEHKPRKGKARKERFTRKTHNASRGRLVRCEE